MQEAFCSYYGRTDENVKPKHGVHLFVIDEYLKRSVEKITQKMEAELEATITKFKKYDLFRLDDELKLLRLENQHLFSHLKKIAKKLEVTIPDFKAPGDKKKSKLSLLIQSSINEDDEEDTDGN